MEGEEETAAGRKKQEEEEIRREKISQLKAEEKQELIEVRKVNILKESRNNRHFFQVILILSIGLVRVFTCLFKMPGDNLCTLSTVIQKPLFCGLGELAFSGGLYVSFSY